MPAYGTDSEFAVPVTLAFSYNGTVRDWGTARLESMAPLSNSAESIDGNYRISDMDVQIIDTDGSVWTALGHGTTCFNKEFSAAALVGNGTNLFALHQGKVTFVSKKDRLVRITSKNNLRLIKDLEWRFPYRDAPIFGTRVGTYFFFGENLASSYKQSVFDVNEDNNEFDLYAAVTASTIGSLGSSYPSISGRGTLGLLSGYHYPGTQFYFDYPRFKLEGTYLGTKSGTINSDEEAYRFGFSGIGAAEAGKTGGSYVLNKTRLHVRSGTVATGDRFFLQQKLTLSETPANLFREMITGHCVSPYFTTSDIDSSSFLQSQRITAYQTFTQDIHPKETKAGEQIKNLLESVNGLFAVNSDNKFEFRAYGPRNLQQTIGSIPFSDILESEQTNDIEDFKNRVTISYGHSSDSGDYQKAYEMKSSDWEAASDRPLELESKWLKVDNEAVILAQRLFSRFHDTVPKIKFRVPLKYAGAGLGSLLFISDPDSGLGSKVVELTGYRKDFTDSRDIQFEGVDGDKLYNRKGYGYWGPGTVLPGGAVSGTSTLGWGTNGTVANINETYYGSMWVWW